MHSDSSSFSLNPIETEVRRRVWWMLCQVDVRVSENIGLQPHVPVIMDTELPMHINDSDLSANDMKVLKPQNETTEMTLSLCKIEMTNTILRFRRSTLPKSETEEIIRDQLRRYEHVYLEFFFRNSDLHRLYRLGIRLLMARLWKMMYDATDQDLVADGFQEPLILYNADVLEIARQLPSKYRQYGWFFSCKLTGWHAIAYLLIQMCKHTQGSSVDRAWDVLDATFADWQEGGTTPSHMYTERLDKPAPKTIWKSMLLLYEQACKVRRQSLLPGDDSVSANPPSMANAVHETCNIIEDLQQPGQSQADEIGDPFFGSTEELNVDMNWGQLDDWVQKFQEGMYQQDLEQPDEDIIGTLNWW